jgi:hypothetical protein
MTAIPMALPLASSQPGPIHTTPDGRVWFGRADRVNPDTQMFEEASLTLTSAPRQGDDIWVDGNAITIPLAQPLPAPQPAARPAGWPTLDDLDRQIAEARAALAGAPRFHAAAAKATAGTACWRAQRAVLEARIAVADAQAAAERERQRQEEDQRSEDWLAVIADHFGNQSDLSELDHNDHSALTPYQRNTSLQ